MPNIILKKTFKIKPSGFSVSAEKSLSFHGSMSESMVNNINRVLSTALKFSAGSNVLQFRLDAYGHYFAEMNHACQKHHEEDIMVAILDVMENLGYIVTIQYDAEINSEKMSGSSVTSRELFIFRKVS